jgi:hypothetical protein
MFVHARQRFETVAAARLFADLAAEGLHPELIDRCQWVVEFVPEPSVDLETGEVSFWDDPELPRRDCGAECIGYDEGWACAAGHGHVFAEVREAQGWEYAEDEEEERRLARAGVRPVPVGAAFG